MPNPSKDYRENPKRAIYITGRIDQQLLDKITPAINEFRFESSDPITAYVDSPGGSVMLAETIRYHIQAPGPDGHICRLITVVTSRAASAAADFVALGDYAIGYPYSDLVYHGTRQSADSSITTEMAAEMARHLQQSNEASAVRLARRAFPRFLLRLSQFKDKFHQYTNGAELSVLTASLRTELSRSNGALVAEALKKQRIIGNLGTSVISHLRRFKDGGRELSKAQFEAEMLRAIVRHKVQVHRRDPWLLSESGLEEVTDDFNLLFDFHFGSHRRELERLYKTYGELFLSEDEKNELSAHVGTPEERARWLLDKSSPKLRPIWYLIISICRLLQGADHYLTAIEAYWLGLVDEAPGTNLPCIRTAEESTGGA